MNRICKNYRVDGGGEQRQEATARVREYVGQLRDDVYRVHAKNGVLLAVGDLEQRAHRTASARDAAAADDDDDDEDVSTFIFHTLISDSIELSMSTSRRLCTCDHLNWLMRTGGS